MKFLSLLLLAVAAFANSVLLDSSSPVVSTKRASSSPWLRVENVKATLGFLKTHELLNKVKQVTLEQVQSFDYEEAAKTFALEARSSEIMVQHPKSAELILSAADDGTLDAVYDAFQENPESVAITEAVQAAIPTSLVRREIREALGLTILIAPIVVSIAFLSGLAIVHVGALISATLKARETRKLQ